MPPLPVPCCISLTHTHKPLTLTLTENQRSLVVDYNVLANEQQVIAFFLPEAPTEMLKIFDEVSVTHPLPALHMNL